MAFIDGVAVRFEDLPNPVATTGDIVTVFSPLNVSASEAIPSVSTSDSVTVFMGQVSPTFEYSDGYQDGEVYGFSSPREKTTEPVTLGETDDDKKTISFTMFSTEGRPASGIYGEGDVCSPSVSQIQTNRDLAGYANAAGTFVHLGDGKYRYTYSNSEVSSGGGEGNIWLRVKVPGFRTAVLRTPIRAVPSPGDIRDAIFTAARSGHITTGTVGEGVAIATAMLQGNFYMDTVTNTASGQTLSRIRCFLTGAAAGAATFGGSGEGEFATFLVTTTYSDPDQIATHRVVQQ